MIRRVSKPAPSQAQGDELTAERPFLINVKIEFDPCGLFFATSSDLWGFRACAPTLDGLDIEIPSVLKGLLELKYGGKVIVMRLSRPSEPELPSNSWGAIPAGILTQAHAA